MVSNGELWASKQKPDFVFLTELANAKTFVNVNVLLIHDIFAACVGCSV